MHANTPTHTDGSLPSLGETIRDLARQRGLKAFELAERVGVSRTSMSHIMSNTTRPRQSTFTRLSKVLCASAADEKRLVSAFLGSEVLVAEEEAPPSPPPADEPAVQRIRAEQYLERKAQSIGFRRSVAKALDGAGARYRREHCEAGCAADFLVERGDGARLALECRFNTQRDFEKAVAVAAVLREQLRCAAAWVVVPFDGGDLAAAAEGTGVKIVALGELAAKLGPWTENDRPSA